MFCMPPTSKRSMTACARLHCERALHFSLENFADLVILIGMLTALLSHPHHPTPHPLLLYDHQNQIHCYMQQHTHNPLCNYTNTHTHTTRITRHTLYIYISIFIPDLFSFFILTSILHTIKYVFRPCLVHIRVLSVSVKFHTGNHQFV